MSSLAAYLASLRLAAEAADSAESVFRREVAERSAMLAAARATAYRRVNFIQAIAELMSTLESEEIAVATAQAHLRTQLGWTTDSEACDEVLSRIAPLAQALFGAARNEQNSQSEDPGTALATFETWYSETRGSSFWHLFEHDMPETPRVDF